MVNFHDLSASTPASVALLNAQEAQANQQWQQVCANAEACIAAAPHEPQIRHDAKVLLANGLTNLGKRNEAIPVWLELHHSSPNDPYILGNLGETLLRLKQYDDAIQCFQRATQLAPKHVMFYMFMALAYFEKKDFTQARLSYQAATNIAPEYILAKYGMARMLEAEERVEEAIAAYEQVLLLEPNYLAALGNLIFLNHSRYPFDHSRQTELLKHFGKVLNQNNQQTQVTAQPHTPLRIGIVSADLCRHVVSCFLEGTLEQLRIDPSLSHKITLVAYANQAVHDEYTERLQTQFHLWRQVHGWSDEHLIDQINQDQIDILIDLSGHTQGNRLPVFAKRAAPVQISWLGYWGSTGLSNIDYILADPICVPFDEEYLYSEKVWRLPALRYCFSPLEQAPDIVTAPCTRASAVVFGSYQKTTKINDHVLELWAKILNACPNARLRIQSMNLSNPIHLNLFITRMQQAGINTEQVHLVGGMATQDYLATYAEVDILLDTFPYTGGTTTIEALWMGVPTLTFTMLGMLGRQGEALMVNADLPEWIAHSEDEYIQKAIQWGLANADQRQNLSTLRLGMREQVRQSRVFNAKLFAQDFVEAMSGIWQEKCLEKDTSRN